MEAEILAVLNSSPGLMAKDIGQALGKTKKDVNPVLYRRTDLFKQDSDFRWYPLAETLSSHTVTFPNGWMSGKGFELTLPRDKCLLGSNDIQSVILKFERGCNPLLESCARILSLCNQLVHLRKDVTLDFTRCLNTRSYLDRAGFFDLLSDKCRVLPSKPDKSAALQYRQNSQSLVELGQIYPNKKGANDALPEQLKDSFVFHAGPDYNIAAFTVFSELVGNVEEHSHSPINGFASLQAYLNAPRPHIQIVVSDSGEGIPSTLKRKLEEHYPDLYVSLDFDDIESDIHLVVKAFTEGGLSQFGPDPELGRGLGLKTSRDYALKYNANITIRQEEFEVVLLYKGGKLLRKRENKNLHKLLGTHVCFDFFLD